MSLFTSILHRLPAFRRLLADRDGLRGERDSMRLKVRAASAEMGVLEEQCRVLQFERDRLKAEAVRQASRHDRQTRRFKAVLGAAKAVKRERDDATKQSVASNMQRDMAIAERDRLSAAHQPLQPAEAPADNA